MRVVDGGGAPGSTSKPMWRGKMMAFLVVLLLLLGTGSCFNIDLPSRVLHASDQPDSMFGFAVAMHRDSKGVNRLLVGAPRYNTEQRRWGVRRAGAVLKCSAEVANSCEYVPFDRNGNNRHPLGEQLDEKSFQWFGATLKSSANNGVVLACAPRYTWFTESLRRREPVGTCYVARNDLKDFQEYSPCRTRQWGYHRQGSCQAGFDAALSEDGDRLFIGAPGAYYWQGQIHSQSLEYRNDYVRTGEGPARDDDQYLGYSVGAGDFTGDGIADVALGVPKGLNYTGKIAIYSHDLVNLQNITGYQLGSYFGYCLAVTDFNQDGRDDLIVGSPMYTDYEDREMKYEVGRVHILLQNSVHRFKSVVTLEGTVSKGRFGLSVAALGDINMDGYNDIAVGAPYGGLDGQGAVFIYHGFAIRSGEQRDLQKEKPAQIIYSNDVSPSMSTFGWSLSGGVDMDDNLYPDLVVGAYLSNSAVILKTRPIVSMVNHTLVFLSEGRTLNIEQATCQTRTGAPVPCVDLRLCLSYSGVGVGPQVDLDVKYSLDEKVNEPRIFFLQNDNRIMEERISLTKDSTECKTRQVYALPSLKDKLSPLTADVSYTLVETPLSRRRRNTPLQPILNQRQGLVLQDAITIQKNCGPDNVCVPDLITTVQAPDTYVLGKREQLTISVRVTNNAEDAFEALVFIPVPAGLLYNKFVEKENTSVTCSPRKRDGQTFIICDIGNPLPMRKGVVFDVLFQQGGNLEKPHFEFIVVANSTNKEAEHTLEDNIASTNVVVNVDTELILYGNSEPEMLEYNSSLYLAEDQEHEDQYGPQIIHKYGLSNKGPSDVLQVDIVILWPMKTLEGNHLLYLLEQPFTSGPVVCDPVPDLNPLNLELYDRGNTYKRLKLHSSLKSSQRSSSSSSRSGSSSSGTVGSEYASVHGSDSAATASGGSTRHYEYSESSGYDGAGAAASGGAGGSGGRSSSSYYSSSSSSGGGGNYSSSHSSSSSSFSSSSSSSSSGYKTGSASQNQIPHQRYERSAEDPELDWENEISNCGATDCAVVRCTAGPLAEGDDLYVYMRSRIRLATLQEDPMFPYKDVQISSRMVARVRRLPQKVNPDFLKVRSLSVSTPVSPAVSLDSPPPVPWWIIVLSILVGCLLLLIIILILWRCGYFKRNRPSQASHDESSRPLHSNGNGAAASNGRGHSANGRNGHHSYNKPLYPGDEAL